MEDKEEYINFITSENYKNQLDVWYRAYNINREKIQLFYDFLTSLYELVNETYLGPETTQTEEDKKNHFTWCWDKTIESFNKEKIYFKDRGDHHDYFWSLFFEAYYMVSDNGSISKIPEYLFKLFDFKHIKSRSELDILTELYKLLNLNLKK